MYPTATAGGQATMTMDGNKKRWFRESSHTHSTRNKSVAASRGTVLHPSIRSGIIRDTENALLHSVELRIEHYMRRLGNKHSLTSTIRLMIRELRGRYFMPGLF